jgi:uncharacterized protein YcbK (DUF882 family)
MQLPRAWPIFLGLFSILSIAGSLLVGRQARAWFEPDSDVPGMAAPFRDVVVERERSLEAEIQVLAAAGFGPDDDKSRRDLDGPHFVSTAMAPRRSFGVAAKALPIELPRPLLSGSSLALYDVNSKRSIRVTPFDQSGVADPEAFRQLRTFMRCRRSGHETDMDPRLIALLTRIAHHFDGAVLHMISGHRKPDGVVTSETSQHAFGMATDIRIPGVSIETIKTAAEQLGARGIGLYPQSRFVHVDVRNKRIYHWIYQGEEKGLDNATEH